jgi:hypothetical protein
MTLSITLQEIIELTKEGKPILVKNLGWAQSEGILVWCYSHKDKNYIVWEDSPSSRYPEIDLNFLWDGYFTLIDYFEDTTKVQVCKCDLFTVIMVSGCTCGAIKPYKGGLRG